MPFSKRVANQRHAEVEPEVIDELENAAAASQGVRSMKSMQSAAMSPISVKTEQHNLDGKIPLSKAQGDEEKKMTAAQAFRAVSAAQKFKAGAH